MQDPSSTAAEGAEPKDEAEAPAPRRAALDVSDEEVDALLAERTAERSDVPRPYGLVAGHGPRARMPVLNRVHERWIGAYRQRLSSLVRQSLDVSLGAMQLMPYAEWQAALPTSSSVDVYAIEPWQRSALVALDGELLFMLVDACYGGVGRPALKPARAGPSPAELRIKSVAVGALIDEITRAFEPLARLEFRHERSEIGAGYVAVGTPSETVVVTQVDVALNGAGGALHLVIPVAAFDSVADELAEGLKSVSVESRKRWRGALESHLEETELELACVFLTTRLSVGDLLRLRPGDILPIEMPRTASLNAGPKPLLIGKFGRSRGYNAVRIIESATKGAARGADEEA